MKIQVDIVVRMVSTSQMKSTTVVKSNPYVIKHPISNVSVHLSNETGKSNANVQGKTNTSQNGRMELKKATSKKPVPTLKPRATLKPKPTPTLNRTKKTNMSFGNTNGSNKGWNGNKQSKKAPERSKKKTPRRSKSKSKRR